MAQEVYARPGFSGRGTIQAPDRTNGQLIGADENFGGSWAGAAKRQAEIAQQGLQQAESGNSAAQQQMRIGMAQAQQAGAQQAVGRGSNPLAQRAAMYNSGNLANQTNMQSGLLRAQETAAARQAYMNAMGQQAQGEMGYSQMGLQQQMAQADLNLQREKFQADEDERERQFGMQVGGMMMSVAGGMAGMSDERNKKMLPAAKFGNPPPPEEDPFGESLLYDPQAVTLYPGGAKYDGAAGPGPRIGAPAYGSEEWAAFSNRGKSSPSASNPYASGQVQRFTRPRATNDPNPSMGQIIAESTEHPADRGGPAVRFSGEGDRPGSYAVGDTVILNAPAQGIEVGGKVPGQMHGDKGAIVIPTNGPPLVAVAEPAPQLDMSVAPSAGRITPIERAQIARQNMSGMGQGFASESATAGASGKAGGGGGGGASAGQIMGMVSDARAKELLAENKQLKAQLGQSSGWRPGQAVPGDELVRPKRAIVVAPQWNATPQSRAKRDELVTFVDAGPGAPYREGANVIGYNMEREYAQPPVVVRRTAADSVAFGQHIDAMDRANGPGGSSPPVTVYSVTDPHAYAKRQMQLKRAKQFYDARPIVAAEGKQFRVDRDEDLGAGFSAVPADAYEDGPQAVMLSDERKKSVIGDVDAKNIDTLRGIDPKVWKYKPEVAQRLGLTDRPQMGPTAQNLEQTPLREYVRNTPEGKVVDTTNLTMANTGLVSTVQGEVDEQEERLRRLERVIGVA